MSELAERDGNPHAKIISTTPSNIDQESGAFCKEVIDSSCEFIEEMYDWTRDEVLQFVTNNSKNDFINIIYTWKQLGLTDDWYEKQCRALMYDWLIINREINLVWTKASDNSVFSEDQLNSIYEMLRLPIRKKKVEISKYNEDDGCINKLTFFYNVYKELEPDKQYFIGVDVAGGLDKDNSTFVVCDPDIDYKPVAVFKNSNINTKYFSLLLHSLIQFLPNSILFIENNSYGKGVIDNLIDIIPNNIYYDYKIADKDKADTKSPDKITKTISYGINTNSTSRDLMMDILQELVVDNPGVMAVQEIYDDIRGLIYNSKGKIEHEKSLHDDCLMGYLFVRYALAHGNNIAHFLRKAKAVKKVKKSGDPATDHGINVNFAALAEYIASGMSIEEAMKVIIHDSTEIKTSPVARVRNTTKVNDKLLNSVLGNHNNELY